jgi:tripeptidyl-peptidase-1
MALAYPANITYYSTGGKGAKLDGLGNEIPPTGSDNEPYLEFLQEMLALGDEQMPHVLSISYSDDEQSVPRAYAERVCDLFAQLTARGVSVIVASGDGGAAGIGQNVCLTNDAAQRKRLLATFPASCPWVTAVGATENEGPPVTAAVFSSGGFSEYFARPSWQDGAVGTYVDRVSGNGSEVARLFNASGRVIPDVSAVGAGFDIVHGGYAGAVMGTSASTPVVAAMVALVNDRRLRQGKVSLGWLNPLLYGEEFKEVLQDVTVGESYGCSFGDGTTAEGWEAGEGYDAVTGLGVVKDFGRLLEVLG